jgi:hypothetical protein
MDLQKAKAPVKSVAEDGATNIETDNRKRLVPLCCWHRSGVNTKRRLSLSEAGSKLQTSPMHSIFRQLSFKGTSLANQCRFMSYSIQLVTTEERFFPPHVNVYEGRKVCRLLPLLGDSLGFKCHTQAPHLLAVTWEASRRAGNIQR